METYMSATPRFNRTNENISWAKWSWNPVTGCLHGCHYCYARDIANRFYPEKFRPTFRPERLSAALNYRPPGSDAQMAERNVFTVDMGDLFGAWVPQAWIDSVFDAIRGAPGLNFLLLTKNPAKYLEQKFPDNTWVGTTVDCQARVSKAEEIFERISARVKWLSCEPLLEPLRFRHLERFDWIVIGARSRTTRTPAMQPDHSWVSDLVSQARRAGCKVYLKPNYIPEGECPKEFPRTLTRIPTSAPMLPFA
jgi:protein gp37